MQNMQTMIRLEDLQTMEQWERVAALRNRHSPEEPSTATQLRNFAAAQPEGIPRRRVLITDGDRDIAYLLVTQAHWTNEPDLFIFVITPEDSDRAAQIALANAEEIGQAFGAKKFACWTRSDKHAMVQALEGAGYIEGQHNPMSMIDLEKFDPAPWLEYVESAVQNGYRIVDLKSLSEEFPGDWMRRSWALEMSIMKDVPMPEPFEGISFEQWKSDFQANPIRLDWHHYAVFDGEWVGMSQINCNFCDPTLGHTGLTGVARDHRRKRLASALKGAALARVKAEGVTKVFMDNEENNPMFQINQQIGVVTCYEYVHYSRACD